MVVQRIVTPNLAAFGMHKAASAPLAKPQQQPQALRFASAAQAEQAGFKDLSELAKAVIPGTVDILVTKKVTEVDPIALRRTAQSLEFQGLGHLIDGMPKQEFIEKFMTPKAMGTGFWIAANDGKQYLVTNNHVASVWEEPSLSGMINDSATPVWNFFGGGRQAPPPPKPPSSEVTITGTLNTVRNFKATQQKNEPVKVNLRPVSLPNGERALSQAKDLAVLEPYDPKTGSYLAPPATAKILNLVSSQDWEESLQPGKPVMKVGRNGGNIAAGIINSVFQGGGCPCGKCFLPNNVIIESNVDLSQGDSGGPLVSMDGKVLGVNTMTEGGHSTRVDGHGFSLSVSELYSTLKKWDLLK